MRKAHALAYKTCVPWYTTIELGLQCNLVCTHCYNFDRKNPMPAHLKSQLQPERILSLIDELAEAGTLMLSFTGGEALMHPQLFDFIARARANHLLVKIKSNGTLVTKAIAEKSKKFEVFDYDISLYGKNALEHDWLTRKIGSFDNTIQGIKNLREVDLPVMMNFILHQKNYQSVTSMIKLAKNLNCDYSISTEMTKRYDDSSPQDEVGLSSIQFRELLLSENRAYFEASNDEKNLQCECARTVCAINHQGDVFPCIGAPIKSGNILESSFKEIWSNSKEFKKIRNLTKEDFSDCNQCELITKCARSSGAAFVNTGNYTGANPQNCQEAEQRMTT